MIPLLRRVGPRRLTHHLRPGPGAGLLPRRWLMLVILLAILESYVHWRSFLPRRPPEPLDGPFSTSCREPDVDAPREDAVLVMTARNEELAAAEHTVASLERHFNRWFRYPIVFFNDEPFTDEFRSTLAAATSANVSFEVVPKDAWGFPEWVDEESARRSLQEQEAAGVQHAGREGYHHMCRFYSGKLYDVEVMQKYRWYWRLEPDTDFYCHITYDPFAEMARRGKVYGFAIALWELVETAPTLFRRTSAFREAAGIPASSLWNAVVDPSRLPWPLRSVAGLLSPANRDRHGDAWSACHYWSNFEIGDMDFFRGKEYREYFEALDQAGGFYFERWGDAPVHSLAIAMLLDPSKVHHFDDIGYRHDNIWQCPANAPSGQLPGSEALGDGEWKAEQEGGIGCRCECDGRRQRRNNQDVCLNRMTAPNTPGGQPLMPWSSWW